MQPIMAGTMTPEQMAQQQQQQAIVEALRQSPIMAGAPQQRQQQAAAAPTDGWNTQVIGGALNKGYNTMFPSNSAEFSRVNSPEFAAALGGG